MPMLALAESASRRRAAVVLCVAIGCGLHPRLAMTNPQQPFDALVRIAIDDLAKRLGIDGATITVIEARAVVWPDGGLGCPRPGMIYPQVQQEGALIRLGAQGREYAYHAGARRGVFLCER